MCEIFGLALVCSVVSMKKTVMVWRVVTVLMLEERLVECGTLQRWSFCSCAHFFNVAAEGWMQRGGDLCTKVLFLEPLLESKTQYHLLKT